MYIAWASSQGKRSTVHNSSFRRKKVYTAQASEDIVQVSEIKSCIQLTEVAQVSEDIFQVSEVKGAYSIQACVKL